MAEAHIVKIGVEVGDGVFDLLDDLSHLVALVPSNHLAEAQEVSERIKDTLGDMIQVED